MTHSVAAYFFGFEAHAAPHASPAATGRFPRAIRAGLAWFSSPVARGVIRAVPPLKLLRQRPNPAAGGFSPLISLLKQGANPASVIRSDRSPKRPVYPSANVNVADLPSSMCVSSFCCPQSGAKRCANIALVSLQACGVPLQ
jgi:hypothetical protein